MTFQGGQKCFRHSQIPLADAQANVGFVISVIVTAATVKKAKFVCYFHGRFRCFLVVCGVNGLHPVQSGGHCLGQKFSQFFLFQIQERMTEQIADAIMKEADAEGVGVVIKAKHLCMMMRGVEKQNSEMTTSAVLGSFRSDEKVRGEFLSLIKE